MEAGEEDNKDESSVSYIKFDAQNIYKMIYEI